MIKSKTGIKKRKIKEMTTNKATNQVEDIITLKNILTICSLMQLFIKYI